jgi:hypothetical protein
MTEPPILTYEESDVPKWKLDRFREWLRTGRDFLNDDAPAS